MPRHRGVPQSHLVRPGAQSLELGLAAGKQQEPLPPTLAAPQTKLQIYPRWIMAMPAYVAGWDTMSPKPAIFMLLSQNPILWQLAAYILPCDVLSAAMVSPPDYHVNICVFFARRP